jgi:hypothetical protein
VGLLIVGFFQMKLRGGGTLSCQLLAVQGGWAAATACCLDVADATMLERSGGGIRVTGGTRVSITEALAQQLPGQVAVF